jgi:phage repressor protein C with HTH and peptisase S24 domain
VFMKIRRGAVGTVRAMEISAEEENQVSGGLNRPITEEVRPQCLGLPLPNFWDGLVLWPLAHRALGDAKELHEVSISAKAESAANVALGHIHGRESSSMNFIESSTLDSRKFRILDMTTMGKRLQAALDTRERKAPWLISRLGVSKGTIYNILNDLTTPAKVRATTVDGICAALHIRREWLLSGDLPMDDPGPRRVIVPAYEIEAVEDDEDFDVNKEVWVEGVDIEVSAGPGAITPEFIPTKYRQRFTIDWLRRMGAKAENLRVMGVRGSSMERTLFHGDRAVIDLGSTKIVSGRVYVVAIGDEVKIKRIFKTADGQIRIVSDNADKATFPDEFVSQDSDRFLIIGRVIDRSGPGGLDAET